MQGARSVSRLAGSAVVGVIGAVLAGSLGSWDSAPAVGWDAAAIVFCLWAWLITWPMSASDTASHARTEDPSRGTSDLITLTACVASSCVSRST